jgi:hypothetical protein
VSHNNRALFTKDFGKSTSFKSLLGDPGWHNLCFVDGNFGARGMAWLGSANVGGGEAKPFVCKPADGVVAVSAMQLYLGSRSLRFLLC